MLVLVAHCDRWTRLIVAEALVKAGCAVVEASNGMSALRLAQQLEPTMIVLGPELAEIAPPDLLRMLKSDERTRRMPVFVLREATSAARRTTVLKARLACTRPPMAQRTRRRPLRRLTATEAWREVELAER